MEEASGPKIFSASDRLAHFSTFLMNCEGGTRAPGGSQQSGQQRSLV
jgi:hypothetical protein